jgi:hypothetical protein
MTIQELREQFDHIQSLRPSELKRNPDIKLDGVRDIMRSLHRLEEAAAKEWGALSLQEIKALYAFLPEVEASLARLEAGKKRREENAEDALSH